MGEAFAIDFWVDVRVNPRRWFHGKRGRLSLARPTKRHHCIRVPPYHAPRSNRTRVANIRPRTAPRLACFHNLFVHVIDRVGLFMILIWLPSSLGYPINLHRISYLARLKFFYVLFFETLIQNSFQKSPSSCSRVFIDDFAYMRDLGLLFSFSDVFPISHILRARTFKILQS